MVRVCRPAASRVPGGKDNWASVAPGCTGTSSPERVSPRLRRIPRTKSGRSRIGGKLILSEVAEHIRSILFGLRTNVQFFASHLGYAALETRLKVFSLLYDQVIVEYGVYEAHIGEQGASSWVEYGPPRPESLRPIKTTVGAPFGVIIQREGGGDAPVPIIGTTLTKAYRAQFFTALQGTAEAKAEWVRFADFGPAGGQSQIDGEAGELASRWNWDERELAEQTFPKMPKRLRDTAHESLNLDLARAVLLGLALAPDGIHAPLLAAKVKKSSEVASQPAGSAALTMLLPDIRKASWNDIAELRRDKGLSHFRDRLRELEAESTTEPMLERAVREALMREIESTGPELGQDSAFGDCEFDHQPGACGRSGGGRRLCRS